MTEQQIKEISWVLRTIWGKKEPVYYFKDEIKTELKFIFFDIYTSIIRSRGQSPLINEKEKKILLYLFNWTISSPDFDGDLQKGLYLASAQGFGKDIFLSTVNQFLAIFNIYFKRFTQDVFIMNWFEKIPAYFNGSIMINDIDECGRVKRERESIPFLELLNYREQSNNRRGLIVSTNYKPKILQDTLEKGRPVQKLEQRIIECFNIIMIEKAESKRIENKIVL